MPQSLHHVVEMLGDVGPVTLQHEAAETTRQLAALTGAQPHFLRIPGVVPNSQVRQTLLTYDQDARHALALLDQLDVALVGIGTCEIVGRWWRERTSSRRNSSSTPAT
jgi:DNA-binding transcriptional regulator LsrR (DeoR family)